MQREARKSEGSAITRFLFFYENEELRYIRFEPLSLKTSSISYRKVQLSGNSEKMLR